MGSTPSSQATAPSPQGGEGGGQAVHATLVKTGGTLEVSSDVRSGNEGEKLVLTFS